MRFQLSATLSLFMLLAPAAASAQHFIEVNKPKPKPKPRPKPQAEVKKEEPPPPPKAKKFEMRLQMSDNQVSRDTSSEIFNRLEQYGFQMAPDVVFGTIPPVTDEKEKEKVIFTNTFFFEIAKFDDKCFIVSTVKDASLRSTIWKWETHEQDGAIPCDVQMKIAVKDYAWKYPPIKQADDFVAIETDIEATIQKLEANKKSREEARKAAEAAEAEAQAQRAAREAERRARLANELPPPAPELPEYGKKDSGMGCGASAAATPFLPAALALVLGAFRRRKN
ncbi:MAG: hypothetical protein LBM75_02025 [Myxococcales bacterium]|jgi:uncharacterized protein (TIGR03382 family)|nr:hypothetical protein [Myxococcales bacterium]